MDFSASGGRAAGMPDRWPALIQAQGEASGGTVARWVCPRPLWSPFYVIWWSAWGTIIACGPKRRLKLPGTRRSQLALADTPVAYTVNLLAPWTPQE